MRLCFQLIFAERNSFRAEMGALVKSRAMVTFADVRSDLMGRIASIYMVINILRIF